MRYVFHAALALVVSTSSALAVPVTVKIKGTVANNSINAIPLSSVPVGAPAEFTFTAESTSGFEPRPGIRVGLMVLPPAQLKVGDQTLTRTATTTVNVFATTSFVPPPQDEIDMSSLNYRLGGISYMHEFKLIDGDDASWPSDDLAVLSAVPIPGLNFLGPNDTFIWTLRGTSSIHGAISFHMQYIVRVVENTCDTSDVTGDMNVSTTTDGDDIQRFFHAIFTESVEPADVCPGDFNGNGRLDADDVPGMVAALLNGPPPPLPSACCFLTPDFMASCINTTSLAACLAMPGSNQVWTRGVSCENLDPGCMAAACCFNGVCQQYSAPLHQQPLQDCVNDGGEFIGFGVSCDPNPCVGACCIVLNGENTGQCQIMTDQDCNAGGNNYRGGGTSCTPNLCMGACCLGDGPGNCVTTTEPDCVNVRMGTFKGPGTDCTSLPCPPLNNACENATAVANGSFPFDLTNATTDGPNLTGPCNEHGDSPNIEHDVWFNYTATCTGTLFIDTCGSQQQGDSTDTKIAIYGGCDCPPGPIVACNDDSLSGNNVCLHLVDSSVQFPVTTGACFKIRVGAALTSPFGRGVLNIHCQE